MVKGAKISGGKVNTWEKVTNLGVTESIGVNNTRLLKKTPSLKIMKLLRNSMRPIRKFFILCLPLRITWAEVADLGVTEIIVTMTELL